MKSTYSVTEAQAALPAIIRNSEESIQAVEHHGKVCAYIVGRARMDAIAKTLELLGNRDFASTVSKYCRGKLKMTPLAATDV